MPRLLRLLAAGVIVLAVLIIGVKLMTRRHISTSVISSQAPPATPSAPRPEDPCAQAVVLSLRSHSGVIAQMSLRNMDGQDLPADNASEDDGRFTTACAKIDNDDAKNDGPPQQVLRLCKPATFVVHITGSGKGLFDFQAKALPEVTHPTSPLLLCNYALDSNRVYDWMLKYQGGSKPAVFLLGSKGNATIKP